MKLIKDSLIRGVRRRAAVLLGVLALVVGIGSSAPVPAAKERVCRGYLPADNAC